MQTRTLLPLLAMCGLFACNGGEDPDTDAGTAPTDLGGTTDSVVGDTDSGVTSVAPIELTPALCDDTSQLEAVMAALEAGGEGGMFGGANLEQFERMMAAPLEPFYMFNLIHYREWAEYADGRETDLTGREANALYSPTEYLSAIGAGPVFVTEIHDQIDGDDILWDEIAVVEYPCALAFFAMISDPGFQERAVHKEAGVETTIAMVTDLLPILPPTDPDQSEAAWPCPAEPDHLVGKNQGGLDGQTQKLHVGVQAGGSSPGARAGAHHRPGWS